MTIFAECACAKCQDACIGRPGRFLPGEAEKAADLLGLTLEEFFAKHLAVEWWDADEVSDDTFVRLLAPAITVKPTGTLAPEDPIGRCSLLSADKRCTIHAAKPHECRAYIHTDTYKISEARLHMIVRAWMPHQEQVSDLLNRQGGDT